MYAPKKAQTSMNVGLMKKTLHKIKKTKTKENSKNQQQKSAPTHGVC